MFVKPGDAGMYCAETTQVFFSFPQSLAGEGKSPS